VLFRRSKTKSPPPPIQEAEPDAAESAVLESAVAENAPAQSSALGQQPAAPPPDGSAIDRALASVIAVARPSADKSVRHAPIPQEAGGPTEVETGCLMTIDLAAIVKNWKSLRQRVLPADCAAAVKADAYGCGFDQVTAELAKAGCVTFFVADLGEARRVRKAASEATIYVLNGLAPGSAPSFAQLNARPVIGNLAEFVEWDAFRHASGWRGGVALHFDTGMNRLGLAAEEAPAFAARVKAPDHGIALIMSHLACADTPSHALNAKQIAGFRELRFVFRGIASSLANSSGIFLGPAAHCDMVRPGGALYGVNPTPGTQNLMEPVVGLKARIMQVRAVERGATVGYGGTWTAGRGARVAIVAAGYADGYLRSAGNAKSGTVAIIANRRCPNVGRVSMDLMAFDVTGLPEELVRRGDHATLIGDGITADDVAKWCGTIGYEVLAGLGRRCRRVWTR
jgi:alanine racemase